MGGGVRRGAYMKKLAPDCREEGRVQRNSVKRHPPSWEQREGGA